MITDIPISNIFIPRNNWEVVRFRCNRYSQRTYTKHSRELSNIKADVLRRTKILCIRFESKSRKTELIRARILYYRLAKEQTKASLSEIGTLAGNKDHATVLHGIKKAFTNEELIRIYNEFINGTSKITLVRKVTKIRKSYYQPIRKKSTIVHLSLTGKPIYETK